MTVTSTNINAFRSMFVCLLKGCDDATFSKQITNRRLGAPGESINDIQNKTKNDLSKQASENGMETEI